MKLVASMVVHNEVGRYLEQSLASLLEFCDEIRVLDDGSTDDIHKNLVGKFGDDGQRIVMKSQDRSFYVNEGETRNRLLQFTMEAEPTHILSIDADEFVGDGKRLLQIMGREPRRMGFSLTMSEVWKANNNQLQIRMDGGWKARPVPVLYAVPPHWQRDRQFHIPHKALACGREPVIARQFFARGKFFNTGIGIYHFGWTNEGMRQERYDRYVEHDNGKFHNNEHLRSIMWGDSLVELKPEQWPRGLTSRKKEILERTK